MKKIYLVYKDFEKDVATQYSLAENIYKLNGFVGVGSDNCIFIGWIYLKQSCG